MFCSILKTRKVAFQFLETVLPQEHQILELGLVQGGHMTHELLSHNASGLIEPKAYVFCNSCHRVTVRWIDRECDLILGWLATTRPGSDPHRSTREAAPSQDQHEVHAFERDAEVLVADQPNFPDAGVTHLEEALEDLSDQSATQQFECRGRVQECSRSFLLLAGHRNIANSWDEIVTAVVRTGSLRGSRPS
jgi:hypothetical protein